MADILLIGVGNPYRRDDAVGLLAAREMSRRTTDEMHVVECSGEGTAMMSLLEGRLAAVVVDAVNSGQPAGTIHRLDASDQSIPSDFFNYSTHAFSVAEAIEMMRVLGSLPPHVILIGVEGADFSAGEGLSDVVQDQFDALVEAVEDACASLIDAPTTPS